VTKRPRTGSSAAVPPSAHAPETGFLLQRAHRRLRAALTEALRPWNLNVGHLGVLGLLYTRGSLSQQQLIDALEIDKSSMVYLVDELERQGLAERRPAPADRRAYAVDLTAQGRERLAVIGVAVKRVQDEFLSPLSPRERMVLNELLTRIAG
jgi:DNA-binding MarR family transcriptional regulator